MKKIEIVNDIVHTKYDDKRGVISLEDHGIEPSFEELCQKHGINIHDYYLLGFGISGETLTKFTQESSVLCTALLLEKEKYGSNFEQIEANIRKEETTDVVKKTFFVTLQELGEYVKRFEFMSVTDISASISKMNIIE